jgi:hypothetical protein
MRVRVPPSAPRSVAQLVARHVWDVEVPGSIPGTPTGIIFYARVWFNGRIGAFQAFDAGSIPATRSRWIKLEVKVIELLKKLLIL